MKLGWRLRRSPGLAANHSRERIRGAAFPSRRAEQWLAPEFSPYSRAAVTALHRLPERGVSE